MLIPFAQWLPDLPDFGNPGATVIRNVLPQSVGGYGPMPSLVAFSQPIDGRCQGFFSTLDDQGSAYNFAGDAKQLNALVLGTKEWVDISRSGGYATPFDGSWSATAYGNRVLFANFADPIQSFRIGVDSQCQPLSANAPRARYLAVVRDWVVAANTFDGIDGARPQRVRWSAIDDPASWPEPGSDEAIAGQSDFQDLVGSGGWIQGIVGNLGSVDGVIFQERAIQRMIYVGPPAIFAFQQAEGARGTPAPGSIVQLGAIVFYLGEDGFYQFDGANSIPIGANRIDKTFFRSIDQAYFHRVSATVDPINKIVFWAYPASGTKGGDPNRLLAYNWAIRNDDGSVGRWSESEIECEVIGRALTVGQSLETLDKASSSLDELPSSLDSRVWTGGRPVLAAFDRDHRLSYFNGTTLGATVESGEVQLAPGRRSLVEAARPLVDGGDPSVAIAARDRLTDPPILYPGITPGADGRCPQRVSGRYHRVILKLPNGSTFRHLQGVDLEAVPGERR